MPNLPKRLRPTLAVKSRSDTNTPKFQGISKENSSFYNSRQWRKVRLMVLERDPICKVCEQRGKVVSACVVDHIDPISNGGAKLYINNLQGLCTSCHNSKSSKERR